MTGQLNDIQTNAYDFLSNGGESETLIRSHNWSETSLGPISDWPQSLRTTLGIMVHSAFPMVLFWGKELTCFYNDAFRPSLGIEGKHPGIGKKGSDLWADIWQFIGPLIEQVMATGKPVWFEDQLVPFYRNGRMEDIYWTFSYSPAYHDNKINGVFVTCMETTRSVQTNKSLLESEKRFQSLIRDATVGVIVLTGEDNVVEIVNQAYGQLINRTVDELINRPLFSIIPETESHFRPIIDRVRTSEEPYYLYDKEYFAMVNGVMKTGFLNLIYQPYRKEGRTIGVMVLCQEITAQVHSRRRAEETDARLRALVASAPFPIAVYVGREMRIQLANQSIMDVWGKGNDVVGKLYTEILPELSSEIFSQVQGVYTSGVPFHARNQRIDLLVNGQPTTFYFNYSFTPLFDPDGKVYGVMNTGADVTDLNLAKQQVEQSERNFRNMILQSPVAMCLLMGPDHVIEVANDSMIDLWGKQREHIVNKPVFDALPDAREQGLEQLMANVYQTGETFKASERPVDLVRNGKRETVFQDFVYDAYRAGDGSIVGVLAISIDVTEQVLARQRIEEVVAERTHELKLANHDLQKSNADLAQFAYIASHDLQEPIRKIRTFAQMLESSIGTRANDIERNYFSKINTAASRMHTLVRDVLTYSEVESKVAIYTIVDLQQVVESIKADYELLIEQKGARIVSDKLPSLHAIPLQMSQLFGNLIGNALKFTRKDVSPFITITASEPTDDEVRTVGLLFGPRYFKIQVADNGIGFKREHASQIFNIFQRLHRKSEYEGTGIGLALCKKITLNHHGDITAVGSSESGAVFNIYLPVRQR